MVSAMTQLFNILPNLALVGLALSGLEGIPSTLAHQPAGRAPRDHHRHLVARQKIAAGVGAQERRRKPTTGLIRRNANGSMCRVRSSTLSSSTTTSVSVAPTGAIASAPAPITVTTTTSAAATSSTDDAAAALAVSSASTTDDKVNNAAYAAPSSAAPSSSTAAASSSSVSTTSSYSGSSSGGWTNTNSKLGAAWPNGGWASSTDPDYIGNYVGSKTSWYYTWSPFSVSSGDSIGLEFVPMLWGPNQVSDWWAQQSSWPKTVKNALFFNEPNEASQCNMAASDSVSYWMNDMVPMKSKGIALGGAATTSAPGGVQWILNFKTACTNQGNSATDCTMAFVPIHWYDVDVSNFQSYVQNFHEKTGLDIWITEYACQNFNGGGQCSDSDTWSLHQSMAPWFDEQDYIKRYAPFGMMKEMQGVNKENALMGTDGRITSLGSWYIGSG